MAAETPPGGSRGLTAGEIAMAQPLFGDAIRWDEVRVHRRRWWPLQPGNAVIAPDGHLWFPPDSTAWREDFATALLPLRRLFVHELTHVWQAQTRGRWWLPLMRHPFCRYAYQLREGWPLERYGIEQQAEIVADAYVAADAGPRPGQPANLRAAANPTSGSRPRPRDVPPHR